jgi:hypothetical protein
MAMALSGEHSRRSHEPLPGATAEVTSTTAEAEPAPRFLQTEIPFGPFLALAAGIFALFQPALAYWYVS